MNDEFDLPTFGKGGKKNQQPTIEEKVLIWIALHQDAEAAKAVAGPIFQRLGRKLPKYIEHLNNYRTAITKAVKENNVAVTRLLVEKAIEYKSIPVLRALRKGQIEDDRLNHLPPEVEQQIKELDQDQALSQIVTEASPPPKEPDPETLELIEDISGDA
jgi:hypothetical protein